METSHRELRDMVADVDDLHHQAMHTFKEETAELHLLAARSTRRRFLAGAAATGVALAAAPVFAPTHRLLGPAAAQGIGDVDVAVFAESVELAAVAAYQMAAGVLSAETKPVGELFAQHHQDHAGAFAALAGEAATVRPNAALVGALTPQLEAIDSEQAALEFAFVLENQAAATYAFGLTVLTLPEAIKGTSTILPVESAHAGVLGAALGKDLAGMFPTDAFILAQVGDGSDPDQGLDPARFPVS